MKYRSRNLSSNTVWRDSSEKSCKIARWKFRGHFRDRTGWKRSHCTEKEELSRWEIPGHRRRRAHLRSGKCRM